VAAPAAQALEVAGALPVQPTDGNVNAWNVGLITAHRPEVTPDENRGRMAELRADVWGARRFAKAVFRAA
jgi:hypothetical protein